MNNDEIEKVHQKYVAGLDEVIRARQEQDKYYSVVVMTETPDADAPYKTTATVYHGGNPAHDCYSIAKGVTGLGLGILHDRGLVDLEDPLGKYLGKYVADKDSPWNKAKIIDVLHHAVGAKHGIDIDCVNVNESESNEWLDYCFKIPIIKEPDQEFVYSDLNYYIIARVIEDITGMDAERFIEKEVFLPLGFHQNAWSRDNHGHTLGGTGLYCRTVDLCKFAMLLLNDGVWNGKHLVSENWIRMMEKPAIGGRGIAISMYDENSLGGGGMYGQGYYANRKDRTCVAWHCFRTDGLTEDCVRIGK